MAVPAVAVALAMPRTCRYDVTLLPLFGTSTDTGLVCCFCFSLTEVVINFTTVRVASLDMSEVVSEPEATSEHAPTLYSSVE